MTQTHIAIMRKSWGLTKKILGGQKKIESRWYMNKCRPWGSISKDDIIYFKDSGEPVTIKAKVSKVLQFDSLDETKVKNILKTYGSDDGIEPNEINKYFDLFKNKKYCLLIFLKQVESVAPFDIYKTGFGSMSAWITVDQIENIKKD